MSHPGYNDFYYEDIEIGAVRRLGEHHVSREEILEFGNAWDPMDFHIDEQKAEASPHGALITAGTHMLAIRIKLLHSAGVNRKVLASGGFEEVRFRKPLYAGETVHLTVECVEKRLSQSKPDLGIAKMHMELVNQKGETVLSMLDTIFISLKPDSKAG